jgi:cation:H+ antiporter
MADWLTFLASATVLVVAGVRVARDGDALAEGTGLGGMWVGAILVAGVTSLPELATDVSAVRHGAPALAIGDLFGSNMANMAILAVADLCVRHTRVLTRVAANQAAVGTLAICLAVVATLGMLVPGAAVLGIGWASAAVAVAYVAGMGHLHRNRPEPPFRTEAEVAAARPGRSQVRWAGLRFGVAALAILGGAPYLASSSAALAGRLGVSQGFVGLLLLAMTTSMAEAVVSVASIRAGSYDLAVGNLLGSNCFNMLAILVLDVADGASSLLAGLGPELVVGALAGTLLTGLAVLGVLDRAERRARAVEFAPLVMLAVYVAALVVVYRLR